MCVVLSTVFIVICAKFTSYTHLYYRAVANGPVGPAMAGPIIETAI